jgi:protein O-mannosyl-transferase
MQGQKKNLFPKLLVPPLSTKKVIALFFLVGFLVYANSLFIPFIGDDYAQVVNNPLVHSLTNIPRLIFGSTFYMKETASLEGNYYKPVMSITFAVLYSIFGANNFFYHLLQLTLHISNAMLTYVLLKNSLAKNISFFLALIFLVHPINSEAVVYISNLQDVLFLFFGLISLLIVQSETISTRRLLVANLVLLLSLLSKESGILFVFILTAYSYLFAKKILWKNALAFLSTFLVYLLMRFTSIGFSFNHIKVSPMMNEPLVMRLQSLPAIVSYYIKTFFFPKDLIILQNWVIHKVTFSNFLLPLLILAGLIVCLSAFGGFIYTKDKKQIKVYVLFASWLILGLALHSQIYPLDMTVSDRWFYFPSVGLLALLGLAVTEVKIASKFSLAVYFVLPLILIVALSTRTIVRNSNWLDPNYLYYHDLQLDPDNYILQSSLGSKLAKEEKYDEAEFYLKKSLSAYRDFDVWKDLCVNYALRGTKLKKSDDIDKSKICFEELIRKRARLDFYLLLSKLLLQTENFKEAEYYLKQSVEKYPKDAESWYFFAETEYRLGKKKAALEAAARSYYLLPSQQSKSLYNQIKKETKMF